jgi:hypothetical protein
VSRKKKEEKKRSADPLEEIWTEITYVCPVRGKVTQKVKGVRYKPVEYVPTSFTEEILLDGVELEEEDI